MEAWASYEEQRPGFGDALATCVDAAIGKAAREPEASAELRGEDVLVTHIVLVETVWVLRKVYKVPKREVVDAFRAVLGSAGFVVEDVVAADAALDTWAAGKGDFADYLIRVRARALGADQVFTFDGELHGDDGFAEP